MISLIPVLQAVQDYFVDVGTKPWDPMIIHDRTTPSLRYTEH